MEAGLFLNCTNFGPRVPENRDRGFFSGRRKVYCSENDIKTSSGFSSIFKAHLVENKASLVLTTSNGRRTQTEMASKAFGGSQSRASVENIDDGIGIVKFLTGKNFFVTGGTGFLAKVLIEKILRTTPDVGKIYVLIRGKNNEAAMRRLKSESEVFMLLQERYGGSYEGYMLSKLVPVVGNVSDSDLGLDDDLGETIAKEVDVIVNAAANVAFHQRYDVSLSINTEGPCHLISFAKNCKRLKLFVQVSTGSDKAKKPNIAYVNGQRQGKILEKLFSVGESIVGENLIDIEDELKLGLSSKEFLHNNSMSQKMTELGLQRARQYGWQDTYVFAKAMGEMMIDSMREDVPVVIIRPSVIESTCREPFPGWIQGNRMMDRLILFYGKGQLTGFLVDPNGVLDVIPADMVVNATLAAMAKHGVARKPDINVYQIASSEVNPLVFPDLVEFLYQHYYSSPWLDSKGRLIRVQPMKLFRSMEEFSQHLSTDTAQRIPNSYDEKMSQKLERISRKSVEQAKYLANIYEPYTFFRGRFDNSNTMESMSEEEKMEFQFDVENIDWKDYIRNVHIPGLRKYVGKERGMPN